MDIISLIMVAVQGLSVVTNNPALGGGSSSTMKDISEFLDLLGELIARGDEGHKELKAFAAIIEGMAAEGRNPTRAEWAALRARSDAAHELIQAAAAAATPEPEPEPPEEPEEPTEPEEPETPEEPEEPTPAEDTLPDDDNPIVEPPQ